MRQQSQLRRQKEDKMEFEKLAGIIADVAGVDVSEIKPETTFVTDLGLDSLDVYQIVVGIEDEFKIQVPDDAIEHVASVQDAADLIKEAIG